MKMRARPGGWLLFLLLLSACGRTPSLPPVPQDGTVLAFGDSITYGMGAEKGEDYPAVLAGLIGRRVVSAGVPGEVTAEGLARLGAELENVRPALLLLCEGGNDFIRKLGDEQAADNLRAMIRLAKERGVPVLLIAVPKPGIPLSVPPLYAAIAAEFRIPLEEKVLKKVLSDGSLKADYIHPNREGYRIMASAVADLMKKSGAVR